MIVPLIMCAKSVSDKNSHSTHNMCLLCSRGWNINFNFFDCHEEEKKVSKDMPAAMTHLRYSCKKRKKEKSPYNYVH